MHMPEYPFLALLLTTVATSPARPSGSMLSERQDRAAGLSASDSSSAHIWVLLTNSATWAPRGESLADAREVGIFYALRALRLVASALSCPRLASPSRFTGLPRRPAVCAGTRVLKCYLQMACYSLPCAGACCIRSHFVATGKRGQSICVGVVRGSGPWQLLISRRPW